MQEKRSKTYRWRFSVRKGICLFAILFVLAACGSKKNIYEINLMPAPDIYKNELVNPFTDHDPIADIPFQGILYATDRQPAEGSDEFYANERGGLLRVGIGSFVIGDEEITWEEARQISLLKNRTENYPIKLTQVEELGVLDRSIHMFTHPDLVPEDIHGPAELFVRHVNEKLERSAVKDIYIYVHGFKVVFNNPLLVAAELWHFLGYEGVFVAYAWPSTPSNRAYVADLETAVLSSQNFRKFLQYLAEETQANRINIIGYSAGTRVVINALQQLALLHHGETRRSIQEKLKIGNVILVGSDYGAQQFGAGIVDGMLNVPKAMYVYISETDKALGLSRWLFKRQRLGQLVLDQQLNPEVDRFLDNNQELQFIDVTGAEGSSEGNGHAYFRKSPWVSSDILITLMYGLKPDERGLVPHDQLPAWIYPEDYIERLRDVLSEELQ